MYFFNLFCYFFSCYHHLYTTSKKGECKVQSHYTNYHYFSLIQFSFIVFNVHWSYIVKILRQNFEGEEFTKIFKSKIHFVLIVNTNPEMFTVVLVFV